MAIIVVLAAVAIPTFGRQLETARETGDMEIIRAAYTEALTMAVLDASDGVLDGQNGDTKFPTTAATGGAVFYASGAAVKSGEKYSTAKYTVTLNKMDDKAKISQTGYNWQYVNRYIGGASVPSVQRNSSSTTTDGTQTVTFQFIMPTSENTTDLNPNVRLGTDKTAPLDTTVYAITVDKPTSAVYS